MGLSGSTHPLCQCVPGTLQGSQLSCVQHEGECHQWVRRPDYEDLGSKKREITTGLTSSGLWDQQTVSHDDRHALAVPLDNSHIKLYDLAGNRLAHLPRRGGQGHHRMVYSVAWSPDGHQTTERCNLFSAGFDNKVIGWKVTF